MGSEFEEGDWPEETLQEPWDHKFIKSVKSITPKIITLEVVPPMCEDVPDYACCEMALSHIIRRDQNEFLAFSGNDETDDSPSDTAIIFIPPDMDGKFSKERISEIFGLLEQHATPECIANFHNIIATAPSRNDENWVEVLSGQGSKVRVTGLG